MRRIIFDTRLTGHHTEYILHILRYLKENNNQKDLNILVLPEEFKTKFQELYSFALSIDNLKIDLIPVETIERIEKASLIKKSFIELSLVKVYAKKYNAQFALLMYFNVFQLALIFVKLNFSVSGILFLQFVQMNTKGFMNSLKYKYKYLMTKLYVRKKSLTSVYLLNDDSSVEFLNKEFNTNKFRRINDPVPMYLALKDFNIREKYNIPLSNKILLHIGSLSERKGTFECIRACEHFPNDYQSNITLLLAGKCSKTDESILKEMISYYSEHSKVQILWINRFLSNEEMQSFFEQCDLVMIPYKNAEASSGILGHAIFNALPVLINSSGLLKKLFDEYGYGVQIENVSPQTIADATMYMFKNISTCNLEYIDKYKQTHNPNSFARELIDHS